jgi:SecD/SecF fusion protein
MKHIYYFFIFFICFSCSPKTVEKNGGLVIEIEINDHTKIEETIDILRKRVDNFCYSNPIIRFDTQTGFITLELPEESDTSLFKTLILSRARFEILETYDNSVLFEKLFNANALIVKNNYPGFEDYKLHDSNKEYPLFQILHPIGTNNGNQVKGATIGFCLSKDTALINKAFKYDFIINEFPKDIDFKWSKYKNEDYLSLIATKKPIDFNPINNSMIETARFERNSSDENFVSISLKQEYHNDWEKLTGENIGNALALVFDDVVYAAPIVQAAIQSGYTQISGNFTQEQTRLLVAFLSSDPIKVDLKIAKIKIVKVP